MTDRPEITAGSVCANRPEPSATELAALRQNLTDERRARLRSALAEVIAELLGDPDLDPERPVPSTPEAEVAATALDQAADLIDRWPAIPLPRSIYSTLLRHRAADIRSNQNPGTSQTPAPGHDPAYILDVAQHDDYLYLECGECDDIVADIEPGDALTDLLASAREHHQLYHAHG